MMFRLQTVLLLTMALLAGCGEVVVFGHKIRAAPTAPEEKSAPTSASSTASASPTPVTPKSGAPLSPQALAVNAVTLVLTPQLAEKVAKDPNFNATALLDAIKRELQARRVLDETNSHANGIAEITVDDFALHPKSNAILFGYIINSGMLNGDIRLRDSDGKELKGFRIDAEAQVSIAANGDSTNPLKGLYHRFAVILGDHLTGTVSAPEPGADQHER
jgi:hypothetical protein